MPLIFRLLLLSLNDIYMFLGFFQLDQVNSSLALPNVSGIVECVIIKIIIIKTSDFLLVFVL